MELSSIPRSGASFSATLRSPAARLASSAATSMSSAPGDDLAISQGAINDGAGHLGATGGNRFVKDDDVDRQRNVGNRLTESDPLGLAVLDCRFYDKKVSITIRSCIAACMGAKQDDLSGFPRRIGKAPARSFN